MASNASKQAFDAAFAAETARAEANSATHEAAHARKEAEQVGIRQQSQQQQLDLQAVQCNAATIQSQEVRSVPLPPPIYLRPSFLHPVEHGIRWPM